MCTWPHTRAHGESKSITDFQINMGIKLRGEGSNPRPSAKPSSDTMLNDKILMDFQINMGIKLQGEGSNLGPPTKPSSDTMLNDQLS